MLPYSRGLILDNTNNYGILKTETVIGFAPHNHYLNKSINSTSAEPLEWIFTQRNFGKSSLVEPTNIEESRAFKQNTPKPKTKFTRHNKKAKKLKRESKGAKKCLFKILKKGGGAEEAIKKYKRRGVYKKGHKKYVIPVILGLLAAKSVLIPIALKALAFLSAKGLMMGFFSTVLASVLSLKGAFQQHGGDYHRKDDTKTQVEIIQVPTKSEDHVYYDDHYRRQDFDDHYKRQDFFPVLSSKQLLQSQSNVIDRKANLVRSKETL